MPDERRVFGNEAEQFAARYLQKKGLTILNWQYKTNTGEIDLVARDGDEIVFVEVKARRSQRFGYPEEAVTAAKLRKIEAVALQYLEHHQLDDVPYRVDVVAIELDQIPPRVTHIEAVGW